MIITIFLMTLIVAITAGLWARHRGARPLMGGIGALLIPLGLYLLGVTRLAYNGVVSLIDWAQRTAWSPVMTWGASLAGVGLLMFVVSRFIQPAARPAVEPDRKAAVASKARPGQSSSAVVATGPAAKPAPAKAPARTAEDDEVEDILRKRGLL
ncbi:hypothetical protein [Tessaracoccus antarcticus]|uniref:hypothetical protein n=1 Tax=Tessaracoccus antarcticus TaxID=2479848 RepID=UPI000EF96B0F|nr:hypothetical protein [Tessaracoccus antarcticus]